MADSKTQFKINKLAKDLGLKSKELTEILAKHGREVTSQKALEPVEFDILFDSLTRENQIDNIGAYLDGETCIPSKKKPKAEPKTETAKKASASAKAESGKPVTAAEEAVKAPRGAETGKAVPAEPAAKAETPKTAAKVPVQPSDVSKGASRAKEEPAKAAQTTGNVSKAELPKAGKPAGTPAGKPDVPAASAKPEVRQGAEPAKRPAPPADQPAAKPASELRSQAGVRPQNGSPQQQRPAAGAPAAGSAGAFRAQSQFPNGGARQQGQPAARQPMGSRPNPASSGGYQPRPQTGTYGNGNAGFARPAGQTGTSGSRPAYGSGQGQQSGGYGSRPQTGSRPSGFGGGRPQGGGQSRSGQNRGGQRFDRDKGDFISNAPRDTFKAQPIVRGAATNVNPDGTPKGPRVVDTRGTASSVDLSKYDEKLETFAPERVNNLRGGNQKVKKPAGQQQGGRSQTGRGRKGRQTAPMQAPLIRRPTSVALPDEIVVGQLASRLMVTAGEVVKKLVMMGMMVTVNQVIEYDYAALVAEEFGVTPSHEVVVSIEDRLFDDAEDSAEQLAPRAPVVCVMGHVDHGKTSILDAIRHTNVTAGEAGGITQHIGAYRVKVKGRDITFLDTPGHEAFTAMRARGAMATDIAILVVAADDGVMPQTVEAINHAKAAGIDIVVAINKMDKPGANPDNIKQELTKYDLVPEEWGGDVICVPVSALKGEGIDDLLESVLLVADMKDLKANPNRRAKGIVIEAKLDKGRGPVATVLVQNGTLHNGDIIIAGTAVGRVRSMIDYTGKQLKDAAPSVPVEITGLAEVPSSGDEFQAVEDERMARTLADQRRDKVKEDHFRANARASLNDLFAQISDGVKNLNIIVKADVGGSVEAVRQSLEKLSNEEVKVRIIHAAAGGITEGDVTFAAASDAIIVGFNVRPDKAALDSAERQNVEIRTYRVIYECIEEIEAAMKGMLAPKFRENLLGHAEVRQTIHVPNVGTIAGCYIQDGKITRQSQIRVLRDSVVIFEDRISSLKRFKDDVREVNSGYECGVGLEKFNDVKVGDVLEAFVMEQIQPE